MHQQEQTKSQWGEGERLPPKEQQPYEHKHTNTNTNIQTQTSKHTQTGAHQLKVLLPRALLFGAREGVITVHAAATRSLCIGEALLGIHVQPLQKVIHLLLASLAASQRQVHLAFEEKREGEEGRRERGEEKIVEREEKEKR